MNYARFISIRDIARRLGLSAVASVAARARAVWLCSRYNRNPANSLTVTVGGSRAVFSIASALEYVALQNTYEARLIGSFVLPSLRSGDCFWDVGANIGFYTVFAAQRVGPSGVVVAIEPEPRARLRLEANLALNSCSNVVVLDCALGCIEANGTLHADAEPASGAHSLLQKTSLGTGAVAVRILPGYRLLDLHQLRPPSIVKIDVEGAEEDAIRGLQPLLSAPTCRALLCEVHFALLSASGNSGSPARILQLLTDCGFKKISWLDRSHFFASR